MTETNHRDFIIRINSISFSKTMTDIIMKMRGSNQPSTVELRYNNISK